MMIDRVEEYAKTRGKNILAAAELDDKGKLTVKRFVKTHLMNNVYSVSKSITATAVGLLITQGKLNLDDKILDFLGEYLPEKYDERLEAATVENLLTHSLGQESGYMFEHDRPEIEETDWAKFVLSKPLKYAPREKMVYSNSVYYLASLVVEKVAGKTSFDFLRDELFVPLGIKCYAAESCPMGHTFGASSYFLTVESMAKIGELYLRGGKVNGKEFLSPEFIAHATSSLYIDGPRFYGLSFWMNSAAPEYYYADGAHGQYIIIHPLKKRVVAVQSYDDTIDAKDFTSFIVGD